MNKQWAIAINVLIILFASFVVISQLTDFSSRRNGMGSVLGLPKKWQQLSSITNIVERDTIIHPSAGSDRYLDLALPETTRVFMTGILGVTNSARGGNYYYLVYHLFPRDVGASIGEPVHFTKDGMQGRAANSDDEILTNGYDMRVDLDENATIHPKMLHEFPLNEPANPPWFNSRLDFALAFLLPLLTGLSGMWLLRWSFPTLKSLPLLERLACGFGLGMMAVAALTLGIKLCGFHGRGVIFVLVTIGGVAELWRDRKIFSQELFNLGKMVRRPAILILIAFAGIIFVFLFLLAGVQGLIEFDAVADWAFKAKIFYLCTGKEIVHWFSNPALAYAHMDYPTLVPSLHAATYDSIGHVSEFITKFWPTWMLLFLLAALASLNRGKNIPLYFLLALLLLPMTLAYAQMEGGTMPMIFFTTLGVVQCGIWTMEKNPARLGLGLTLLFGAAMTKFEGFIFLAVTLAWILLLAASRQPLKSFLNFWRAGIFCLLSALPFVCLRVQIPALNFESNWTHYALTNPAVTISSMPKVFLMVLARLFVNPDFANWGATNGQFNWIGKWDGISSLIHHLGLGWICLLLSVAIYFAIPSRRKAVLWIFLVFISAVVVLSIVLASFVNLSDLDYVLSQRTAEGDSGRYLFPMLWAWAAMLLTIYFLNAKKFPLPQKITSSNSN